MDQLTKIWEQALELMKPELTEISFNTWIRPLRPISLQEDRLVLETHSGFNRGMLESRYSFLIQNAVRQITGKNCEISFILPEEAAAAQELKKEQVPAPAVQKEEVSQLNPKYTFDTFVIGNSNRFAHAAALAVAEVPAQAYNPLFIYGGVGLGKTHLMHAIGHYIRSQNPEMKILYVTSEKFTNELITAIQTNKNEEFRRRYRSVDVLLIDDIQFIAGKESTTEEFFHTFNALHDANKQIIISSDKQPREIPTLEERLRSRFEWGLIADIQPPDLETRIAILRKKAHVDDIQVEDDVLLHIAHKVESNIRELEGALTRVVAYASLSGRPLTVEVAEEALRDILPNKVQRTINPQLIQRKVGEYFSIRPEDFLSKRRNQEIALPRQYAMYLCREMTDLSLPRIGEAFGGRDHTTVIHACDKITRAMQVDMQVRNIINELKRQITEG
ncbi:chromosomal replication initiator protein DnaA [Luoshenia tenuis]|jgi:chromosomal replication initiator protein|uniref:chromosomal replication initiator protein DnaA n=1 Tax=Luoshenia tenuis TaxID=2763654 RepID=UPI003D91F8F8